MRTRRVAVLVVAGIAAAGCFTASQKDFDDYAAATQPFRDDSGALPAGDAAPTDSAPPTEAVDGLYAGACYSQLAAGRIDRVLRFYTQTKFTPDASGGGGKLTMSITPLKLGPQDSNGVYAPPPAVSVDQQTGKTFTITDQAVDAKGVFDAPLGEVTVPGNANPISGRDIIIDNTDLPGRFASASFCTELSGNVTQPLTVNLVATKNTCVFRPVKDGDPFPTFVLTDFSNGCPLN